MAVRQDITLELQMRGPSPRARLDDFTALFYAVRGCTDAVSERLAGKRIEYEVSKLRSQGTLATTPILNGVPRSVLIDVRRTVVGTILALESDKPTDPRLDFKAIKAFERFTPLARKPDRALVVNGHRFGQPFAENLKRRLEPTVFAYGTITGKLDAIDIHGAKREFWLYPGLHNEEIECVFKEIDKARVTQLVGRRIKAYGKLAYAPGKVFPRRAYIEDFTEVLSGDRSQALLASAGKLKLNKSVEDFIREIRNAARKRCRLWRG